jgi:hypothetical protein
MLLTRWIKNRHFMNDNLRKYLGYAAGEIVLVIVGILIALQIDAWYDDKQVRTNLNAQLRSVAESISQDLAGIANLKRHRTDSIMRSNLLLDLTGVEGASESWYNSDFVGFVSRLIASSQVPVYFVPATGAFQSLESSGNANHILDPSLKRSLNDYYATVERIVFAERELNSLIRDLNLKYETETTSGMFKVFLQEPLLAWETDPETGEIREDASEFRDSYFELIYDSVTQTLVRSNRSQPLLKEYQHLLTLGNLLVRQIDAYIDDERQAFPGGTVFNADSNLGPAEVFYNGRFEAHSFGLFDAPTQGSLGNRVGDVVLGSDYLGVNYRGGDPWAFFYVTAGPIDPNLGKYSLDFSRFDRIRLELRRESGCEDFRLVLKDAEDADDGSQADVRLELSGEWEIYEYPLSLFADADLGRLNVVTGFLMFEDACSFSVRDVTYLEPGES